MRDGTCPLVESFGVLVIVAAHWLPVFAATVLQWSLRPSDLSLHDLQSSWYDFRGPSRSNSLSNSSSLTVLLNKLCLSTSSYDQIFSALIMLFSTFMMEDNSL